jgi:hypothetical protein
MQTVTAVACCAAVESCCCCSAGCSRVLQSLLPPLLPLPLLPLPLLRFRGSAHVAILASKPQTIRVSSVGVELCSWPDLLTHVAELLWHLHTGQTLLILIVLDGCAIFAAASQPISTGRPRVEAVRSQCPLALPAPLLIGHLPLPAAVDPLPFRTARNAHGEAPPWSTRL